MSQNCIASPGSVSEGHPDKAADNRSDAIPDVILTRERYARVVQMPDLLRPIYGQTAIGHSDADLTWERTGKADSLRAAAGIKIA